jgi:hypothetical protein
MDTAVVAAVINSGRDPGTGRALGAEWYGDDVEVAAVAAMLAGCGWLDSDRDHATFRSEPWRWSAVRDLWVRSGRPTAADPDWELFVECLD